MIPRDSCSSNPPHYDRRTSAPTSNSRPPSRFVPQYPDSPYYAQGHHHTVSRDEEARLRSRASSYPNYDNMQRNAYYQPMATLHPPRAPLDEGQSYFQAQHEPRAPVMPFSPSDYDSAPSFVTPRLPPSPPSSPPFRTRSPSPLPSFNSAHRLVAGALQLSSFNSSNNNQKRTSRSIGSIGSFGSSSRPSHPSTYLTPSSADTDVGRASDIYIDLSDLLLEKMDEVITNMDTQSFSGRERDLVLDIDVGATSAGNASRSSSNSSRSIIRGGQSSAGQKTNYFSKVYHYANSRLPPNLPPLSLFISTWPLICLAAQSSQCAYSPVTVGEHEMYVDGDIQSGTKSMVIKSAALDHRNVIVFAIRGTNVTSFSDWATNMDTEPTSPMGFLDDAGNLCHAGFLSVARRMVRPIALRLEQLLHENPSRAACSLVITGHSAGGAVASLLYAHLMSKTLRSELIYLREHFKRIHCFTFGSPPVSILPLGKPANPKFNKWLFYTFINEGDPIARAEKPYIRSLINLYKSPAPQTPSSGINLPMKFSLLGGKDRRQAEKAKSSSTVWKTPAPNLMLAGCLILLRGSKGNPKDKNYAEACLIRNEDLTGVVFGDVMMHMMSLYERRLEMLATDAVTAKFSS